MLHRVVDYFGADFSSNIKNFHLPCTRQCRQQKAKDYSWKF